MRGWAATPPRRGSRSRRRSSSVASSTVSSFLRASISGSDRPRGRTMIAARMANPISAAAKTRPTTSQSTAAGSSCGTRRSGRVGVSRPDGESGPRIPPVPCRNRRTTTITSVVRGSAMSRPAPPVAGPPAAAARATTARSSTTPTTAPPARIGSRPWSLGGAATRFLRRLQQDLCRSAFGRKLGALDVADVLAVDLERERTVGAQLDLVEVVQVEDAAGLRRPCGDPGGDEPWNRQRADRPRGDEVETVVPTRLRRETYRQAPDVGVRVAVRDERERDPPVADDLDLLPQAAPVLGKDLHDPCEECAVGRPPTVLPPLLVDPADDLRGQPHPGREPEAAAVHPPDRDRPRAPRAKGLADPLRRCLRIGREPKRARKDARAATRNEADRDVAGEAVQRLVERPVAAEDDDRLDVGVTDQLDRVSLPLRPHDLDVATERAGNALRALVVDGARLRVDDEEHASHVPARCHARTSGRDAAPRFQGRRFVDALAA